MTFDFSAGMKRVALLAWFLAVYCKTTEAIQADYALNDERCVIGLEGDVGA